MYAFEIYIQTTFSVWCFNGHNSDVFYVAVGLLQSHTCRRCRSLFHLGFSMSRQYLQNTTCCSSILANLSSRRFRGDDGNASSLFGLGRVSLRMAITNLLPSTSRQQRENFCFGVVAKTYVSTPVIT